jgi:hypothetical protein
MKWTDGKIITASLLSKNGGDCKIRYRNRDITIKTTEGKRYNFTNLLCEIDDTARVVVIADRIIRKNFKIWLAL